MSKEFQRTYNDGLLFILQAVKIRLNLLNQIWEKVLYKQKVYLMGCFMKFFFIVNEIFEWKIYSHIGHHYSKIIFRFFIE